MLSIFVQITTQPPVGTGSVTSVGDGTSHTLNGVVAGLRYSILVSCTNGAGTGPTGSGSGMSSTGGLLGLVVIYLSLSLSLLLSHTLSPRLPSHSLLNFFPYLRY